MPSQGNSETPVRTLSSEPWYDWPQGAAEIFDKDERQEVDNTIKKAAAQRELDQEFRAKFRADRRKLHKVSDAVLANPKNKKSPLYMYSGPAIFPATLPSQQEAKTLLPPKASLWRGYGGVGSWQGHLKPHARCAASFTGRGGAHGALRRVLQRLWQDYLCEHGLSEEACLVKQLFDEHVDASKLVMVTALPSGAASSGGSHRKR